MELICHVPFRMGEKSRHYISYSKFLIVEMKLVRIIADLSPKLPKYQQILLFL